MCRYTMNISLNVLNHLGIHLYSNSVAVLSETVANAWDADAESVNIEIKRGEVVITDTGLGMTLEDINERFLHVGYQRREDKAREDSTTTKKGRKVMGRKGIGKLSLFSIADQIEVYSRKEGYDLEALRMDALKIQEQIQDSAGDGLYHPEHIPEGERMNLPSSFTGTAIRLSKLKASRMVSESQLRARLARRFGLLELEGFSVEVNGAAIAVSDRRFYRKIQYLWVFGEKEYVDGIQQQCPDVKRFIKVDGSVAGTSFKVQGWIGTAVLPKDLVDSDAGNLNSIILLARGRPIHENILDEINDGRLYSKYLIGEIDADFLDDDSLPDIATSSRQALMEDDERFLRIKSFIKKKLDEIADSWTGFRNEDGEKEATQLRPAVQEWLNTYKASGDVRKSAGALVAHIQSLPIDDEKNRTDLFKHGILAFERLRLKECHKRLEGLTAFDSEQFGVIVESVDEIEAGYYYEITNERLGIIRALAELADDNALEKEIQKHVFDHMWLLDPSWERAAGSEVMEETVRKEFGNVDTLTEEERKGRLDIRYKKAAGSHVIVELKRSGRQVTANELYQQAVKYINALKKCIQEGKELTPHIEVIFLLGQKPNEDMPGQIFTLFGPINARYMTYREIVQSSMKSYGDYLETHKETGKLSEIINRI